MYRSVSALMFSLMNRTDPSPMRAFTPPPWKLNASSFGPQLFTDHRQVLGPPIGVALLLILACLLPVELLGPEVPLPPASGSAQAYIRRQPEVQFTPSPATPSAMTDSRDEPDPKVPT